MATVNANTVALYIDVDAGTYDTNPGPASGASPELKPVLYSTSASLSVSNSTYETNYKAATAATGGSSPSLAPTRGYGIGATSASLTVEGIASWDTVTDTVDLKVLFDECVGKQKVTAVWSSTDGNAESFGGKGFITSFSLSSGVDDFATFRCTVELDGDPATVA